MLWQQIFDKVILGNDVSVGLFVILGEPPKGFTPGQLETYIGSFSTIRSHTVIYAGNQIGEHFQTGHHVLVREFNNIGDNVSIGSHSVVEHHVQIGNNVRLHTNVFIPEFSVLEDDVWVGPNVVFTNARYPRSRNVKKELIGPKILAGAKIGANSTLLPDIIVGRNALIGAGTVVTKDVPENAVVVGNPGRIINWVNKLSSYDILMEEERK